MMSEAYIPQSDATYIACDISLSPVVRCINADIFENIDGRSEDLNSGRSLGKSASISFKETDVGLPWSTQILLVLN